MQREKENFGLGGWLGHPGAWVTAGSGMYREMVYDAMVTTLTGAVGWSGPTAGCSGSGPSSSSCRCFAHGFVKITVCVAWWCLQHIHKSFGHRPEQRSAFSSHVRHFYTYYTYTMHSNLEKSLLFALYIFISNINTSPPPYLHRTLLDMQGTWLWNIFILLGLTGLG